MNVAVSRMAFRSAVAAKPTTMIRASILRQTRPFHNSRSMLRAKVWHSIMMKNHKHINLLGDRKKTTVVCRDRVKNGIYELGLVGRWIGGLTRIATAHTITQRLRTLKRIPPELLPLGVVILFALGAAAFAMGKKLVTDKTLRLNRSGPKKEAH